MSNEAAGSLSLLLSLLCVTVVVVVVVVSVCAVWCGDTLKIPRVYVQNVPVCTGNTSTCVNTCGCGAGTHGDVLNGHTGGGERSSSVLLTKICPRRVITCPRGSTKKPMHVTYFQFEE